MFDKQINGSEPQRPPSEVNNELSQLGVEVGMQGTLIHELRGQLQSVLANRGTGQSENKSVEPVLVPLAQSIKDVSNSVAINNALLRDIITSLEL